MENVSGVRTQPALGLLSNVIVRGFTNQNIYRNGLKSNDNFAVHESYTANVQSQSKWLKAPRSFMVGRSPAV